MKLPIIVDNYRYKRYNVINIQTVISNKWWNMLDIYTVAFFGHRYIDNLFKVEELLEEQIRKLINEKEYVDFLVGRNGDFDQCV